MRSVFVRTNEAQCTGCRACEAACSFAHLAVFSRQRARLRVAIHHATALAQPRVCRQCAEVPCASICPTGAFSRESVRGIVELNPDNCIGCEACVDACPHGEIFWDRASRLPLKCDLCNGSSACLAVCPHGALELVGEDAL